MITHLFTCKGNINLVIKQLEKDSTILLNWFSNNALKANPDKFHLLLSDPNEDINIIVDNYELRNNKHKKLLGIIIDNKMKF